MHTKVVPLAQVSLFVYRNLCRFFLLERDLHMLRKSRLFYDCYTNWDQWLPRGVRMYMRYVVTIKWIQWHVTHSHIAVNDVAIILINFFLLLMKLQLFCSYFCIHAATKHEKWPGGMRRTVKTLCFCKVYYKLQQTAPLTSEHKKNVSFEMFYFQFWWIRRGERKRERESFRTLYELLLVLLHIKKYVL